MRITLASDATARKRVLARFLWDQQRADALAKEIATLRTTAYEGRLAELMQAMGVPGEAHLYDPAVLKRVIADSRGSAASVLHTHNADLRQFVAAQPRGLSQRDLASRVKAWEAERADWKHRQIVDTEGQSARNQADDDVLRENGISSQRRAVPSSASEPLCAALVARGWMNATDSPELPLHPGCKHGWEYRRDLSKAVAGKPRIWAGQWIERSGKD
jgi:hypothetical protein